jgi:hypothetical protein
VNNSSIFTASIFAILFFAVVNSSQWWRNVLGTELDDNVVVDDDLAVCLSPSSLDQCNSMKILYRLLNRMLSSGQDDLGPVDGSPSGQLRTRAVYSDYSPFYHLSVHVPILGGLGLTTWNSAFPSNEDSQISDPGTLKSDYMKGSDHPWETRLIRTIYSPVYDNSHHFATQLDVASVSFDDTMLTYCHFPEINLRVDGNSCFGYNSNSFAIGLINHVGGILSPFAPTFGGKPLPNLTGWSHPGMNKPVPSNAF